MTSARKAAQRGSAPAPRLTREALVDAAVALADAEGLESLTIRRLAREIGVTPMALYWHVKDKDELLEALGERMFAEVDLPPERDAPWDEELREVLWALLSALARHPALASLALPTVLTSEPGAAAAERVLVLLNRAGLGDEAIGELGAYLLSSIVTLIAAEPGPGLPGAPEDLEQRMAAKRAHLSALDPVRFPMVARLADNLLDCDDQQRYFRRGVELLVLGLRGLAASAE